MRPPAPPPPPAVRVRLTGPVRLSPDVPPRTTPRKWLKSVHGWNLVVLATGLLGAACATYFCLRGTGELSTIHWLPRGPAEWADHHGRLRNLPAYALLTMPFLLLGADEAARRRVVLLVGTFGTLLELAEIFVPARMVEWQDVAWTWAGAGSAWLAYEAAQPLLIAWRAKRRARPAV